LKPKGTGILVQKELAETLKKLRDRGAAEFYQGQLGRALVENLRGKGAILDLADLGAYRAVEREALAVDFPFGKLWGMPPPSSGGVGVLRGMILLEKFFKKEKSPAPEAWTLALLQTMETIFRERNAGMGDPDFVKDMPIKAWLKKDGGDTSHLSVMDGEGNAVAVTLTINLSFGSCVTAGDTGILMNDEMDDFAALPGVPNAFGLVQSEKNAVAPGKRPLSSMSPTLVTKKDRALLALGSPGGPRIITSVLQTLMRRYFLQESLEASVAGERLHYQVEPPYVSGESDRLFGRIVEKFKLGTRLQKPWGNVQAVAYDPKAKRFEAVSDPRGQGKALVLDSNLEKGDPR
ncbi:MAG: gamma-glutamyltransferase, partial [Deltaproteobacteria bacterium]|nr:gamma-glutamyltransferase [Deltaproteobacteria bacterium]